jgi:hypothetical protein
MTEQEWLASTDSLRMLQFLGRPSRERKTALFCVACCRRLGGLLSDPRSVGALAALEKFAEGDATAEEVAAEAELAGEAATGSARALAGLHPQRRLEEPGVERRFWAAAAVESALSCALWSAPEPVIVRGINILHEGPHRIDPRSSPEAAAAQCQNALLDDQDGSVPDTDADARRLTESKFQAALLRCIVGNPFRPATVSPAVLTWRAGNGRAVAALAAVADEERLLPDGQLDAARLAVLADALEDVGCTDQEILGHLRGPGLHVRGCWALDLLLLKE